MYLDTVRRAMDIPRRVLDPEVYRQSYEEFSAERLVETPRFPSLRGKEKQEELYNVVDEACASSETISRDDWRG